LSQHAAPRKVVVGTCIYPMYRSQNPWPGLDGRLTQLAGLVDDMAKEAEANCGGGLDLAVLPIGAMIEALGLETVSQVLARNIALQDEVRPGPVPGRP